MLLMLSLITSLASAQDAGPWAADLAAQRPSKQLVLECGYTDASRQQAQVLAEEYLVTLHMGDTQRSRAVVTADDGPEGELSLEIESGGVVYSSLRAQQNSRINLYRRGPYYLEVHWFDVDCVSEAGDVFPAKGEVVLYCYADQLLVQTTWHCIDGSENAEAGDARIMFAAGSGGTSFDSIESGDKLDAAMPLRVAAPPPAFAITLTDGVEAHYDAVRGCYMVTTDNPGGFSYHYYENPNHYETAQFSIQNDATPRKVYVCHETRKAPGSVECGVVLDADGDPLPIMVQISKNFAGEIEEKFYNPTDIPFSETFFPLHLAADEKRDLTSLHMYQNWGNHPLKQFSSLGAWMDYYHSSTGVTETTCFVPFKFGGIPGVAIADLRPMSQRLWPSQPQHDNVAGHRFLMYMVDGDWHYSKYEGTTFRSTGPNWMDISIDYTSDDGTLRARVDSFELPQTDELRNFLKIRIDVIEPLHIDDLSTQMRVLDITSRIQSLRYQKIAYQSADGEVEVRDVTAEDKVIVAGESLGGEFPWATEYGAKQGCNSFVVRGFSSSLGGVEYGPAVVAHSTERGDTHLALSVDGGAADLVPGDFIEADFYIMPYGNDENEYETPEADRVPYGDEAPWISDIAVGRKLSDFPTRIRSRAGKAKFSVHGGKNLIPIIVEGLPTYKQPRLEVKGDEQFEWNEVPHSTVGNDGYQVFVDERGTFGCVFLVDTDGSEQTYRVTTGRAPEVSVTPKLNGPDSPGACLVDIQAPWMNAPINLRFPETIITDFGILFIDHFREDMVGKTEAKNLEQFHAGPGGSFWYDWTLAENCRAGGIVSPGADGVTFESWFYNGNDTETFVDTQFCLRLWDDLLKDETGERTHILSNGEWLRMSDTDRGKGRRELCHYPCIGGLDLPDNDDPTGWGRGGVTADIGLVAVESPDGKNLIGLAFPRPKSILSNWLIPCVHADPAWPKCPPKGHVRVSGKLYMIEGDLEYLQELYYRDFSE